MMSQTGVVKVSNTINPFKGKTPKQIDSMFRKNGVTSVGKNPIIRKRSIFKSRNWKKILL